MITDRHRSRVTPLANGCHLWTGTVSTAGYGSLRRGDTRRQQVAHRAFYEDRHGTVPAGYQLHHVCENKLCVNPDHLLVVTPAEHNALHPGKAAAVYAAKRARTHCANGHEYTPENTVYPYGGTRGRRCVTCKRAASARGWERRKLRAAEAAR